MMTPRTQDEYLDLVDQAIFEIEDVLMCAQDEGDPEDSEFSGILPVYELLSKELKKLQAEVMQGKQVIGGGAGSAIHAAGDEVEGQDSGLRFAGRAELRAQDRFLVLAPLTKYGTSD